MRCFTSGCVQVDVREEYSAEKSGARELVGAV
jgi:hypothetical protein